METNPLQRAISEVGSQSALARAIGVTQQSISHWLINDRAVPAEVSLRIEAATGGKVTRAELRPDIFGAAA